MPSEHHKLPYYVMGKVIKGFGRGSKQLGIPTANFPPEIVNNFSDLLELGVYYGWAAIDKGPIFKMVMSVGWNPFYKNKQKSMETHVIHKFDEDFYGSDLKLCVCGYIRPEKNFGSLEELISAIKADIAEAEKQLEKPEHQKYKCSSIFTDNQGN